MSQADYTDIASEAAEIDRQEQELAARKVALARRQSRSGDGIVVDEDGTVVGGEPGKEVEVWPHKTCEHAGESWQFRPAQPKSLAAFAMATSKYVPAVVQNNMTALFFKQHLSDESFERFLKRWGDPDDAAFGNEAVGELVQIIAREGTDRPIVPS